MFWRCLHRRGLPLAPFILLVNRQYFAADYELITSVGRLTNGARLNDELDDFRSHSRNRGFVRRRLRIRVSGARLSGVFYRVLPNVKSSPQVATGTSSVAPKAM